MKKTTHLLSLFGLIAFIVSCTSDVGDMQLQTTEADIPMDRYINIWNESKTIRNKSPYSMSTVRKVKKILSHSQDAEISAIGNMELSQENIQYYYKIPLNSEENRSALREWLDEDENRTAFDFPLDSISMYPERFEGKLNKWYQQDYAYTCTFADSPLPSEINAAIIDTLYVPNSQESADEYFVDIMAHILTANISPVFMTLLDEKDPSIVDNIDNLYTISIQSGFVSPVDFNPDIDEVGLVLTGTIEEISNSIRDYSRNPPGPQNEGSIAFWETQNNGWEGINNIRIRIVNFTFLTHTAHFYNTDAHGNFNIGWLPPGIGTMVFEFANSKVKVIDADLQSWGAAIWTSLNLPYAARDVRFYAYTQPGRKTIRYSHGTKSALWGMIMNGVQEANRYTLTEGMRGSEVAHPHLTVYGAYRDNRWGARGSAPMFSHTLLNAINMNYLSWLFGIAGTTAPGTGNSPDLIICQSQNNSFDSRRLRETIFHEYGHSLHYFKVGATIWTDNVINSMATSGYGTAIDTFPGSMFALTEGWADYVGHSFAARKYPTASFQESNNSTGYDEFGSYIHHLENNRTYFNAFIPRGLFYDLTDAYRPEEGFDKIGGFGMNDIYRTFKTGQNTIEKFRDKWQEEHPNPDNDELFNTYTVP